MKGNRVVQISPEGTNGHVQWEPGYVLSKVRWVKTYNSKDVDYLIVAEGLARLSRSSGQINNADKVRGVRMFVASFAAGPGPQRVGTDHNHRRRRGTTPCRIGNSQTYKMMSLAKAGTTHSPVAQMQATMERQEGVAKSEVP